MTSDYSSNQTNSFDNSAMQQVVIFLAEMEERNRLLEIVHYETEIISDEFYGFLDRASHSGDMTFRKVFDSINLFLKIISQESSPATQIADLSSKELLEHLESLTENERLFESIKYEEKLASAEFGSFCHYFFSDSLFREDIIQNRKEKYAKVLHSIETLLLVKQQRIEKQNLIQRNKAIKNGVAIGIGAIGVALLVNMLGNTANSTPQSRRSSRRHGFIGGSTNYPLKCGQCGAISETGGICNYCHSDSLFQENIQIKQDRLDYVQQQRDIEYQNFQNFNNYQDFY